MSEYDTRQMSVILVRMEKKLDRLEMSLVTRPEMDALKEDVHELQEAQKWLTRTAVSALVLAVLDPMLSLFGG